MVQMTARMYKVWPMIPVTQNYEGIDANEVTITKALECRQSLTYVRLCKAFIWWGHSHEQHKKLHIISTSSFKECLHVCWDGRVVISFRFFPCRWWKSLGIGINDWWHFNQFWADFMYDYSTNYTINLTEIWGVFHKHGLLAVCNIFNEKKGEWFVIFLVRFVVK